MTIDVEAYESLLAAELAGELADWQVAPTDYSEALPNSIIVAYDGMAIDNRIHGSDPRSAVVAGSVATMTLKVRFLSARNAARGVFNGIAEAVMKTCRALGRARRELWRLDRANPLEVAAEGESPVRALDAYVEVDLVIEGV